MKQKKCFLYLSFRSSFFFCCHHACIFFFFLHMNVFAIVWEYTTTVWLHLLFITAMCIYTYIHIYAHICTSESMLPPPFITFFLRTLFFIFINPSSVFLHYGMQEGRFTLFFLSVGLKEKLFCRQFFIVTYILSKK